MFNVFENEFGHVCYISGGLDEETESSYIDWNSEWGKMKAANQQKLSHYSSSQKS